MPFVMGTTGYDMAEAEAVLGSPAAGNRAHRHLRTQTPLCQNPQCARHSKGADGLADPLAQQQCRLTESGCLLLLLLLLPPPPLLLLLPPAGSAVRDGAPIQEAPHPAQGRVVIRRSEGDATAT